MLELAVLGLLNDRDLHGYELKKRVAQLLGSWSGVSSGSLYPALARLESTGALRAVEHDGAHLSMPMTGAISGEVAAFRRRRPATRGQRNKKIYAITDRGRSRFHELLTQPDDGAGRDETRSFALRVAFCRFLEPAQRLSLFARRREQLESRLAATLEADTDDPYLRSLREHDSQTTARDLEWLDSLIDYERAHIATAGAAAS
jgi:DNA-binding PadR family transcriptional regulator